MTKSKKCRDCKGFLPRDHEDECERKLILEALDEIMRDYKIE